MSETKIKICGLFNPIDINFVNIAKPDYIGFVFAKSRRQISIEKAKLLKEKLDKEILAVGVFVDEDIENIEKIVSENIIDIIQLHGKENEAYIAECKRKMPDVKIIKALQIGETLPNNTDFILYDAPIAGSGKTFDWSLLPKDKEYFLAGGINLENIDEAIKINPYCIDLSSGAEKNGAKDGELISALVQKVRKSEQKIYK